MHDDSIISMLSQPQPFWQKLLHPLDDSVPRLKLCYLVRLLFKNTKPSVWVEPGHPGKSDALYPKAERGRVHFPLVKL